MRLIRFIGGPLDSVRFDVPEDGRGPRIFDFSAGRYVERAEPPKWPRVLRPDEAWEERCVRCGKVFDPNDENMGMPLLLGQAAKHGYKLLVCAPCWPDNATARATVEQIAAGVAQIVAARAQR